MAQVRLDQVKKSFGSIDIVKGVDLEIPNHSFVALVGPSGCGKTTTLRMIAGLEDITDGEITIAGRVINDVPPKDRDIAMVFQSYALYPHMTVFENMSFGLKLRGMTRDEVRARVQKAADILHISDYLDRLPKQLSGGQRQRVAMGRAIVREPKVFLFDEPLSNLDAKLRVKMRTELKQLHQKLRTTTVYVTHDQIEAMTLADKIVVMNGGRIEQCGTPWELYNRPKTRFVAGFMGSPAMNILDCRIEGNASGLSIVLASGLRWPVPPSREAGYTPFANGEPMLVGIRPEHITDGTGAAAADDATFEATVDLNEPTGQTTLVFFGIAGTSVCAMATPGTEKGPGSPMTFRARLAHMHLIDPVSGQVV